MTAASSKTLTPARHIGRQADRRDDLCGADNGGLSSARLDCVYSAALLSDSERLTAKRFCHYYLRYCTSTKHASRVHAGHPSLVVYSSLTPEQFRAPVCFPCVVSSCQSVTVRRLNRRPLFTHCSGVRFLAASRLAKKSLLLCVTLTTVL